MIRMRNFQDTFKTFKRSFISAFSVCMTVPLKYHNNQLGTDLLLSANRRYSIRFNLILSNLTLYRFHLSLK